MSAARQPRLNFCFVSLLLLIALGCKPEETIQTYTVERTRPPREPISSAKIAKQFDHTIAAMLPLGDQVYFFKLVGKEPAIARQREAFLTFLKGVTKGNSAAAPLEWTLPEGWTKSGPSDMRLETLMIPDEGGRLELAISSLPNSGTWPEYVALNANRWLGQLGQSELPRQTILNLTTTADTPVGEATIIELRGVQEQTMPTNPHAGSAMASTTNPPVAPPQNANAEITYKAPDGWELGPEAPVRQATYIVSDGDKRAEMTISGWPTKEGSQMADVNANVQRWAGQVGMSFDDKLAKRIENVDIGGAQGSFVELIDPKSSQAMLAAMVVQNEKVWFFKLLGPTALVTREKENFREMIASVQFK